MVIFYKKWKKYNESQLTKKNGLEQSKNEKLSTSLVINGLSTSG